MIQVGDKLPAGTLTASGTAVGDTIVLDGG